MTPALSSLIWLSTALAGFAAAATLTTWLIPVLRRHGAVTAPGPDGCGRALPRGGGLAIAAVCGLAGIAAAWLFPESRLALASWLSPAAIVAAVSLRDDFRSLPALLRLAVHVAMAAMVVALVGPVSEVSLGSGAAMQLGAAAWPLTVLWIVGMTNAFNFMDGIDGIAGITAAAAAAAVAGAGLHVGADPAAVVAVALAAGALGFLTSNWPPARVFMGDVGSTFCGFTIAVLPLIAPAGARRDLMTVVMAAMWPFVFDAAFTLVKRVVRRENVLEQHRSHIYQRLVIAGWSHRAVATLYGFLAAMAGGIAVAGLLDPAFQATADTMTAAVLVVTPVLLLTLAQTAEAGSTCRA